ncbi:hypothetical protein [Pseudooceanicola algae]|uniref:Uncharacterized protein n=1 Tax=Pseudooceanicola algae TaxID=1537215 RepID=A0A418SLD7_9RHOB|nr:hypothetical protein [Pseudooceanicola algae]QPM90577.1 hypothetical protein PSAL_018160 [Pseudooceanicola algae]
MFRRYLAIVVAIAMLLAPISLNAQQSPALAPPGPPAAAPARSGTGLEFLIPLALFFVFVGALARKH